MQTRLSISRAREHIQQAHWSTTTNESSSAPRVKQPSRSCGALEVNTGISVETAGENMKGRGKGNYTDGSCWSQHA